MAGIFARPILAPCWGRRPARADFLGLINDDNKMQMTDDDQHKADTFGALEDDPNGKRPNEAGAKLDAGKNRLGLVLCGFARALQAVGAVGTYGANKYSDNGWMEVPDGGRRYTDAMLRHLMREATGEEFDPDTGLHHAAHCCWNALARLDIMLRRTEEHDSLHK
jgi:hypothetical protein